MRENENGAARWDRIAWWAGAAAVLFLLPMILGFLAAQRGHDGPMSTAGMAVLGAMVAGMVGGTAALVRWRHVAARAHAAKGPSERANHRLLGWAGALGGAIGLAMAVVTATQAPRGAHPDLMSGALPTWFALGMALVWATVLPVISWRWHRVVDEHERDAYRDGAVAGYYVMAIGAPVWWFLWRGGLAPAVDSFALFMAVMIASGGVWMWRKYA